MYDDIMDRFVPEVKLRDLFFANEGREGLAVDEVAQLIERN